MRYPWWYPLTEFGTPCLAFFDEFRRLDRRFATMRSATLTLHTIWCKLVIGAHFAEPLLACNVAHLERTRWSTYCTILRRFDKMIVVPHNNILSVSEITLSYLIVAIYTAEDVFVQSISEWLSKMANGKSQMVAKWQRGWCHSKWWCVLH